MHIKVERVNNTKRLFTRSDGLLENVNVHQQCLNQGYLTQNVLPYIL